MEDTANRHRRAAPAYCVGDKVYLSLEGLKTQRPTDKLDYRHTGPYPVTEVISSHAYRLKLPLSMGRMHDVFHTSLLSPIQDPLPGQIVALPPPTLIEGNEEYLVKEIVDSRLNCRRAKFQYLVL